MDWVIVKHHKNFQVIRLYTSLLAFIILHLGVLVSFFL